MLSEAIEKISGLENTFWRTEGDKSHHNLSALSYRVRLRTSGSAGIPSSSHLITRNIFMFTPTTTPVRSQ